MTDIELTIKNPHLSSRSAKADFLVDSGVAYTVVPKKIVKELGLKPSFYREFILADGKKVKRAITLEAFGLALDPFQRKLYKAKMML